MDTGDQIAPTSPKASRRAVHVSEQIDMDPIIHHQVLSLPKEAFKLCSTDFIWYVNVFITLFVKYLDNYVLNSIKFR